MQALSPVIVVLLASSVAVADGVAYVAARSYGLIVVDVSNPAAPSLLGRLTTREQQVLERIVAGRLNKQIADDLGISIKTVEAHRANIMEKLNVNTVADLLRLALSRNS